MCGGCSSDNNQTNMTFQVLGAGIISLSVVPGVTCIFHVGLMIWTAAVAVDRDRDRDRGSGRDGGNGNNEQQEWLKNSENSRNGTESGR
jgi:hypothetical protein